MERRRVIQKIFEANRNCSHSHAARDSLNIFHCDHISQEIYNDEPSMLPIEWTFSGTFANLLNIFRVRGYDGWLLRFTSPVEA